MIDPIVCLSFSVYSNPGVYALLLGSGISRAAKIPTGWEIVIDLIEKKAWRFDNDPDSEPEEVPIPESEQARCAEFRQSFIAKLAEHDDEIMIAYLEGDYIDVPELRQALRRVTLDNKGVPVLCGSALKNMGIQPLLDAVVDYLPSPLDIPPISAIETTYNHLHANVDPVRYGVKPFEHLRLWKDALKTLD